MGLSQDPFGKGQARGFAPQLAMTTFGHGDAVDYLDKVGDADHFLGHINKVQLPGEKTLNKTDAKTLNVAQSQAAATDQDMVVAADGVSNFGHG